MRSWLSSFCCVSGWGGFRTDRVSGAGYVGDMDRLVSELTVGEVFTATVSAIMLGGFLLISLIYGAARIDRGQKDGYLMVLVPIAAWLLTNYATFVAH